MKRFAYIVNCLLFTIVATALSAQQFGKNKIQYKDQDWHYIQSEHFDLYYYGDGLEIAETAAGMAETAYEKLSHSFNYKLRDRISIILYNSHNDFEETNLNPGIVGESTGGFTEFKKNRVVLPYEGSMEQFRHVIHHELAHAVTLQFYFGSGPGAIVNGLSRLQLPLWFVEGLAEYESLDGWNTSKDQIVRDAVQHNYLPPMYALDYSAYNGGMAVFSYIAERYGKRKVTELYNAVKITRSVKRGFQKALGQDLESFHKKWTKYLKGEYWPEVKLYQSPDEFSTPLTNHEKTKNYINNAPALSPKGDLVAFLSDKDGLFDIYLMSTLDKRIISKLVSGQRTSNIEELKWLRPGISWSPDSKSIVFAAKAGRSDVLHIVNVRKTKIEKTLRFEQFSGIFSPTWSPNGRDITFVAMHGARSDLFTYNLNNDKLTQITDDQFTDLEPMWSHDGKKLVFISDREDAAALKNANIDFSKRNYSHTDIFVYDAQTKMIKRITSGLSNEKSPVWFQGTDTLLYVSDKSGIFNIYLHDLKTDEVRHLTNLISGANQLSVASGTKRLAYTSFYKGGYDIYLWKNPLQNIEVPDSLQPTSFLLRENPFDNQSEESILEETVTAENKSSRPFRHYVFGKEFAQGRFSSQTDSSVSLNKDQYMTSAGEFKTRKYTPRYSIDYAGAVGGYNTFYGVQGATQLLVSDLLGNHQFMIQANIIQSIKNSDLSIAYANLKRRWDYSVSAYHFANFFQSSAQDPRNGAYYRTLERFRNYGLGSSISYPFSRFRRIDMGVNWYNIQRDELYYGFTSETIRTLLFSAGYNFDNAIWAYTGPFAGSRSHIGITYSPSLGATGRQFTTLTADLRRYLKFGREYSLAFRFSGGASFGKDPNNFILGGVSNWINYSFAQDIDSNIAGDLYFSRFVSPMRGASFYEAIGNRYFVANAEFKFPLIQTIIAKFPLSILPSPVRGAGFVDIGSAWTGNNFRAFKKDQDSPVFQDVLAGFGWGIRTPFLIGLLRIDQAWGTDLMDVSKPKWYVSFGIDF